MRLSGLVKLIPKPSVILITGRRGSGKDVTACALAEELHANTRKVVYSNYNPEQFKRLPKHWKLRDRDRYEAESVQLISDAHLQYFSRDWQAELSKVLIKIVSVSRHREIDFIYTTQLSTLLDRQAISNLDVLMFKEPSLLAERFERAEVSDLTKEATEYFSFDVLHSYPSIQKWKWQHALVYTQTGKHEVEGIEKPGWFTEEMSKLFGLESTEQASWERIL